MPKLFIFAIGGTGERVLRSFTMLLASGAPTFNGYDIYPIIIDYDSKNADKDRTVELLQNYAAIHNAAFPARNKADKQFFSAKLFNFAGLDNYVFPFQPASKDEKFRDHIGYGQLGERTGTLGTANLLNSLYDASGAADTELNLNMNVGFKGNPNIGSVVFHAIHNTDEFGKFKTIFDADPASKAVIIGSLFGGTGASGIPEIVKAISGNDGKKKNIATILVLPYFSPMENKTGAIQASRFNSKTKAAINFYNHSGLKNKIEKIYYVGDPYPTVIPYSEGGEDQKNNANLVELIAAMMIEHYVAKRGDGKGEFKFSIDANIVVRDGEKSGQQLYISDFDSITKKNVLYRLAELAIALKLFHDEINSSNNSKMDFYQYLKLGDAVGKGDDGDKSNKLRMLCTALEKFYHKYQAWMKELDYGGDGKSIPANSHRIALCDMTRNYSDIILKEAETVNDSKKSSLFGLFKGSNKEALSADFLLTQMNFYMRDGGDGTGHYDTKKNDLRAEHEPEWVFADILHKASVKGLEELIKTN